jgi:hypothetical protein
MQLPNDTEIIMATLKMKRHAQTAVPPPPSTYAQDVATITSHTGAPALSACLFCVSPFWRHYQHLVMKEANL